MKFRKGGRYSRQDSFHLYGRPINIVNETKMLGITLQPSLTFTKHIKSTLRKAAIATLLTRKLDQYSINTGIRLFNIKIRPIVTYGLTAIAEYLKVDDLFEIDKTKSKFLKRMLCVPSTTSTELTHYICNTERLSESLINNTDILACMDYESKLNYLLRIEEKHFTKRPEIDGPIFKTEQWKYSGHNNKHLICGFTIHGFHHLLCTNQDWHSLSPICRCRLCRKTAEKLDHYNSCKTLNNLALNEKFKKLNIKETNSQLIDINTTEQ